MDLFIPILFRSEKHNESYAKLCQEYDTCKKCFSSLFRAVKKGEGLNLSGGNKIHKTSEQLLSFDIFRIRSRCHYYDVNLTPKFCLALKKCGHTPQLCEPTVYLYCAYSLIDRFALQRLFWSKYGNIFLPASETFGGLNMDFIVKISDVCIYTVS